MFDRPQSNNRQGKKMQRWKYKNLNILRKKIFLDEIKAFFIII